MTAAAFCTTTASTKRAEDGGGGVITAPATYLASVLVTPLWSVDPNTVQSLGIEAPQELKECYHVPVSGAALPDIVEGDVLTHGGADYQVFSASEWPDISNGNVPSLRIVVIDLKTDWPIQ